MTDDNIWDEVPAPKDLSLEGLPSSWDGWTRVAKVELQLEVVQEQLRKVRAGAFNPAKGEAVAALALEAQLELIDFYVDAEASAKTAKHSVEYIEGEVAAQHAQEAARKEVRVSEVSLKRVASISEPVKTANQQMILMEKEYKKWRYVYETLREAHIFFRNITRL